MKPAAMLMTVEEFASSLHETVTTRTVRTLIHQGKINAVKLGKRYYLTHEELERFASTCPANASQPDSFKEKTMARGLSSTEAGKSGQATVMDFVAKQKML
ncbi:MAG: hypothetical protein COC12_01585 [Rhodobacteraceae bacterium]|nr:MAG: hypothetical protein COC12_01585 [Paracoccaceae bacterium]